MDSVTNRDLPAVQSAVLVLVVFTLAINTIVDLCYTIIDPRVRRVRS
nr:ABC transporter permease subunit [uncultured Corynebacterium sp.]